MKRALKLLVVMLLLTLGFMLLFISGQSKEQKAAIRLARTLAPQANTVLQDFLAGKAPAPGMEEKLREVFVQFPQARDKSDGAVRLLKEMPEACSKAPCDVKEVQLAGALLSVFVGKTWIDGKSQADVALITAVEVDSARRAKGLAMAGVFPSLRGKITMEQAMTRVLATGKENTSCLDAAIAQFARGQPVDDCGKVMAAGLASYAVAYTWTDMGLPE